MGYFTIDRVQPEHDMNVVTIDYARGISTENIERVPEQAVPTRRRYKSREAAEAAIAALTATWRDKCYGQRLVVREVV